MPRPHRSLRLTARGEGGELATPRPQSEFQENIRSRFA